MMTIEDLLREIELIRNLSIKTIGQISLHEPDAAKESLFRMVDMCDEIKLKQGRDDGSRIQSANQGSGQGIFDQEAGSDHEGNR